jgi:hypothetical protein
VKYRSYNKETKLAIAAIISVFNNIVISRYDREGNLIRNIPVPVRYAHESTIVKSIRNKDKALQLPIIAIARTSQERDMDRVCDIYQSFFKQGQLYNAAQIKSAPTQEAREKRYYSYDFRRNMPQPINIGFSVKIWASYEEDLNQILGNFIPFFNPYVAVSSYHPYNKLEIIRNKLIWDGTIDNELPEELDRDTPQEWKATINFTYQTWFWYGMDKDKFTQISPVVKRITSSLAVGNLVMGDKPTNDQWVDENGNIYNGYDTGKNINDGYSAESDEFIDEYTGEIYSKYDPALGITGGLKDGFFIADPNETIKNLTRKIENAQTSEELPYNEQVIDMSDERLKEAEAIKDYSFENQFEDIES